MVGSGLHKNKGVGVLQGANHKNKKEGKMSKVLVVYYSFEGHTKKIAEKISQNLNADILEVKPKNEKKSSGFSKFLWGGSQVVMKKSPELEEISIDFSQYDEIYLGTPIWAWSFAPPIRTLFEKGYIKGKKINLFYTHGGGPGKAEERIREEVQKENTFGKAIEFLDKDIKNNEEIVIKKLYEWLEK